MEGLAHLDKQLSTLIVGGYERGLDLKALAKAIIKNKPRNLILLPETGDRLYREVLKLSPRGPRIRAFHAQTLAEVVKLAFKVSAKNSICLFSPGAPSFNWFANYQQRGTLFKKQVRAYARTLPNND